jgi:beta-phosphoglucomutase
MEREHRYMKHQALVFDLDGVICHTDKYHYLAWKEMADGMGIYFDEIINNRLRGVSRMESLEIILERYDGEPLSEERKIELATSKNEIYRKLLGNMTPADLSDEVKNTLDALRAKGYRLAIGSSSKNAGYILERIGLGSYFDAVSDGNNITKSKPDPEVFLKAAEFLGVEPKSCIVIEDAEAGIVAAKNAGMAAAAIGDACKCDQADYKLSTFSDLLNIE